QTASTMVQIGGAPRTLEKDPVCGMNVDPAKAASSVTVAGKTYHFCCRSCGEKFTADPQKYLAAPPEPTKSEPQVQPGSAEHTVPQVHVPPLDVNLGRRAYVCPMDPEVRQDHPGACPKCGMALEPELPVAATKTQWTCPMHPEIVRDAPGACP